ncbi:MAG: dimethylarginine dimethylaminohydrolase family protein [Steroidobacterales bacterium]
MQWKFRHALVRPPAASFAQGLTSAGFGAPDLPLALAQHHGYCDALRRCGLEVRMLPPDERYPDGTFVEDTAVLAERVALTTVPGAPSRVGEVASIAAAIAGYRNDVHKIVAPGTVDGGDICQADEHFFIGLSARTNAEGARQLGDILHAHGYSASTIDIHSNRKLLHLKSGIAWLGDGRLVLTSDFPLVPEFSRYQLVRVTPAEEYAANCVRVNDFVLIAAGFPDLAASLRALGLATIVLDMSEFRKMDGGLSCLSLRF